MANINRVVLVGNLTRDPDLRALPGGTAVCSLRIAVNNRRKNSQTGEWSDEPNYFTVSVFGAQGENCARFLSKGRAIAIDGRLRWREWDTPDGAKREAVEIVAETVQFIGARDGDGSGGGGGSYQDRPSRPADAPTPAPAAAAWADAPHDDDIPF